MNRAPRQLRAFFLCLAPFITLAAQAATHRLIVVADLGGVSALPYYRALNLLPTPGDYPVPPPYLAPPPHVTVTEADFLPVRSTRLHPGPVTRRVIAAPGLPPIFLIGDDVLSRAWLKDRLATLRALHAVGLIVEVRTFAELQSLRRSAPGLTLEPVSGDDLARRLGFHHYPVLITATGLEQ